MADTKDDPKKYCFDLVQTHLSIDSWEHCKFEDLEFDRIFGGSTSLIFYLKAINCKPEELIVRFHYANDEETNVHDLKFIGESGENLVFHILSKLNFGPKIYSIFNGGRIEEYIPSVQLPDEDVLNGTYHETIIRKIAFVHSLDIPIVKDEKWVLRFYENYKQVLEELYAKKEQIIEQHINIKSLLSELFDFNLINELFWFKECLPKLGCRLVFSHNDITKRNILLRKSTKNQSESLESSTDNKSSTEQTNELPVEEQIVLIDFGDCAYNFRGLDLADYLRCKVSIKKVIKDGEAIEFYEDKEIEQFCIWYLDEFKKHSEQFDSSKDNVNQLLIEVSYFLLLSDLMTILYITLSTEKSEVHQANWSYAIKRIELYKYSKEMFFKKYGDQFNFKETLLEP